MRKLDLMVLGTGPAATRVAMKCSAAGWSVGIADPRPFGGTCALRGCNPKKVLVRAAELGDWIARTRGRGLQVEGAKIDWSELMAFKRNFTSTVTPSNEEKFHDAGIAQFHDAPRFVAPTSIVVEDEEIQCSKIVIATGAVPISLDVPGWNLLTTSDAFLELEKLPRRLLFVGGGYISFEFAHVAARSGAEVTILEQSDRPLRRFDPDLVERLVAGSREVGIDVRLATEVRAIDRRSSETFEVQVNHGKNSESLDADLVVHGAGRVANTAGLDLATGNVRSGKEGIEVDAYLRSVSNPDVYAAGDVAATGAPPLTPVANEEGRTVVHNLLNEAQRKPNYGPVPTVVFSVPALAAVGLGEAEAREQRLQFKTRAGDWSANNSMKKVGAKHACYKVLVEEPSGRILGAHLLGPEAAETINLFALALKCGMTARELKSVLFAFPTFAHDVRGML